MAIKAKLLPRWPAAVDGVAPIVATKANGAVTLSYDSSGLPQVASPTGSGKVVVREGAVYNEVPALNIAFPAIANNNLVGNNSGSSASPSALTGAQAAAILPAFTGDSGSGGVKGLVPAPAAGEAAAGKYLKADGTFAIPSGAVSSVAGRTGAVTLDSTDVAFTQAGTGAVTQTVTSKLREALTPQDFGAKGDSQLSFLQITITSGSPTLTVNYGVFSAGDVGKYIFVPRCGTNGNALVTTIAGFTSSTQITLSANASKSVSGRQVIVRWGTDDGPALQKMFDESFATGTPWSLPPGPSGVYLTAQSLNVRQCQTTFTNARLVPPVTWTMDTGATIKAAASLPYVIKFGDTNVDYSQFLREAVISGGVIDCSFIADIGIYIPFAEVPTVEKTHVKNIKLKGIQIGLIGAPSGSGGPQFNFNSSSRDVDQVTMTGITKANPAVVTAPDHNFSNNDVVTLVGVTGMTEANRKFYRIANVTQNTFELVNTNSTAWGVYSGSTYAARCMPGMKLSRAISGATNANPCVLTFPLPHGFTNGQQIFVSDLGGMVELTQTNGGIFTVAGVTATTLQLSGINSTAFGVYTGNGYAMDYVSPDAMETWLYAENAPDVDTMFNQIVGVRLGRNIAPANSTGYDGKHIKNHFYAYAEAGEMFAASLLGGNQTSIGEQIDGPFKFAMWWKAANNSCIGLRINYDETLNALDTYASIHRIETGANVVEALGGHKAGASARLLDDVSGFYNYLWFQVQRTNQFSNQATGLLTSASPVAFGDGTITGNWTWGGAASATWTPTVTPGAGTITTYTSAGQYQRMGKCVFFNMQITVTNNGTGSSHIIASLPTAPAFTSAGGGRNTTNGQNLAWDVTGTNIIVQNNGAYPVASGQTLRISGTYFEA